MKHGSYGLVLTFIRIPIVEYALKISDATDAEEKKKTK